jgi:predicted nucleic acid-binding protein
MSVVLDASVALTWFLGKGDVTTTALAVADRIRVEVIFVPQLWPLEIANGFATAIRADHVKASHREAALAQLREMVIEIDGETNNHAWTVTAALADKHQLTAYDAAYLELAIRRSAALATLDKKLARAARAEGVEVLP